MPSLQVCNCSAFLPSPCRSFLYHIRPGFAPPSILIPPQRPQSLHRPSPFSIPFPAVSLLYPFIRRLPSSIPSLHLIAPCWFFYHKLLKNRHLLYYSTDFPHSTIQLCESQWERTSRTNPDFLSSPSYIPHHASTRKEMPGNTQSLFFRKSRGTPTQTIPPPQCRVILCRRGSAHIQDPPLSHSLIHRTYSVARFISVSYTLPTSSSYPDDPCSTWSLLHNAILMDHSPSVLQNITHRPKPLTKYSSRTCGMYFYYCIAVPYFPVYSVPPYFGYAKPRNYTVTGWFSAYLRCFKPIQCHQDKLQRLKADFHQYPPVIVDYSHDSVNSGPDFNRLRLSSGT